MEAMLETIDNGPPGAALACIDVRSGFVLDVVGRSEATREVASAAAMTASQLCVLPRLEGEDGESVDADEAIFVSSSWVHAFARVPGRPELLLVGVADASASVAVVLAWVKTSCRSLGVLA